MAFRLAELFVEFTARGISGVQKGIETLSKGILGFAAAGLIGTTQGEQLRLSMQLFSREITAIFLPAIQGVVSWVNRATDFLRGLSATQQDALQGWLLGTAAVIAFRKALVSIGLASGPVGIILTIAGALAAMVAGTESGREALSRIGAAFTRIFSVIGPPVLKIFTSLAEIIADLVVPVLETLAGWLEQVATYLERIGISASGVKQRATDHRSATATPGGMEGIADTYRRLQQATLRSDVNYPKRQTELAEEQLRISKDTNQKIGRLKPAII